MLIGVIGSGGQLGSDLTAVYGEKSVLRFDRPGFDITNPKHFDLLKMSQLDYLINTSAYNEVDKAEEDLEGAFHLNAFAPARLAEFCMKEDIRFVTFSTDYVFGGPIGLQRDFPWSELDDSLPLSVYGISKYSGERMVLNRNPDSIVIRTCGLYGRARNVSRRKNFVDLMLQLAKEKKTIRVVSDQIVTPTSTWSLAWSVREFLGRNPDGGVYHMSNMGECSWYQFAQTIFQMAGYAPEVIPVTQEEYGAKARRPMYSVLSKEKIGLLGVVLPSWESALSLYLDQSISDQQSYLQDSAHF
ncbi:MAG: dTDP-4-dehydrorhamnose reductase [Leptospirales bacterium]